MAVLRAPFRGVNSDQPMLKLASGTATALPVNVLVSDEKLAMRAGFAEYEADVVGDASGIVGLFTAAFSDGSIYVVAKCDDGSLYCRKVYPAAATRFYEIVTYPTHGDEAGWAFNVNNQWYYCDEGGMTQWCPVNDLNAEGGVFKSRKAGLPRGPTPTIEAWADGGMEGTYAVWAAYYNTDTTEEGIVGQPAIVTTRASEGDGAIHITGGWTHPSYNADSVKIYRSIGSTEYAEFKGNASQSPSWIGYEDSIFEPGDTRILQKADQKLIADPSRRFTNAGGEPPPAKAGCWTGHTAFYAAVGESANAAVMIGNTGQNNDILWTAVAAGGWVNHTAITYVDTGALSVTYSATGNAYGFPLITIGIDAGTTTAAQVIAAVAAHATVKTIVAGTLYVPDSTGTNDGSGTVTAFTEVLLALGDQFLKAHIYTWQDGDNNNIQWAATSVGIWGNRIGIIYSNTGSLSVTYSATGSTAGGPLITIGVNVGTTTAAQVITAVANNASASAVVVGTNAAANDGTGTMVAAAETHLATGTEGKNIYVWFSIRDFPTMVPNKVEYTYNAVHHGTNREEKFTFYPKPWIGRAKTVGGKVTEIVQSHGQAYLFTATDSYRAVPYADGRFMFVPQKVGHGCVAHGAAVDDGRGIHALGVRSWNFHAGASWRDLADGRFKATLEDIPAAYQDKCRMAYYSWANQVWLAVPVTGGTVATRILVLDLDASPDGELTAFDISSLDTGEGISAMCELLAPNATPTMLVGTNTGRILQYPSGTVDERGSTDYGYATSWRGVYAAEQAAHPQKVQRIVAHLGDECDDQLVIKWRSKRTHGDDPTDEVAWSTGVTADRDNALYSVATLGDKISGRLFEVEFSSAAATKQTCWTVYDLSMRALRTDHGQ